MIIINGIKCRTIDEVEAQIATLTDDQKQVIRNDFNGVSNAPSEQEEFNQALKIYKFIRGASPLMKEPPFDVDFVTGLTVKLHRKSILAKGEIVAEEFYENFDGSSYTNLIVKETSSFVRDPLGFPIYRDTVVSWYKNNNEEHPRKKTWRKFYSDLEKIAEGKTRRGNLVAALQTPIIGLISLVMNQTTIPTMAVILEGRRFIQAYKDELDLFVDSSNKDILSCLTDPAHPKFVSVANFSWIDTAIPAIGGANIRQYLVSNLTI